MEKIYHVFVSSTYTDLVNERKAVSEAVAKAGYVVEGMEIFPASSQSQMDFIKRAIDRCDYYILILAGRYGSTGNDGVSYTEKEFDYAAAKGIPVLALLHNNTKTIPSEHVETDKEKVAKLVALKNRAKKNSVADFWQNKDELATKALAALTQQEKLTSGVGWIRGNAAAGIDVLNQNRTLRKENEELNRKIEEIGVPRQIQNFKLAELEEIFTIEYRIFAPRRGPISRQAITFRWVDILKIIGSKYYHTKNSASVCHSLLYDRILSVTPIDQRGVVQVDDYIFDKVFVQFKLLGLLSVYPLFIAPNYQLTQKGEILYEEAMASESNK